MLDWLVREGGIVLSWWALVTLAGAAVFPLLARLLGWLPDRGYTLARAGGLLLVGYVFWLLASLGFLRNTTGDITLAWLIVAGFALAVYSRGERIDWRNWWRAHRGAVITTELLFLLLLFGWAMYRAHQNGLTGTEKPMELMFMNAIQRSETFPPNDGWMSGYAISYYYFGYVMSSMLALLSGVPGTIGFNLMIALLFALTGIGAFGIVYNLIRARSAAAPRHVDSPGGSRSALLAGVLALLLVTVSGNFHLPLVEIPYQTGAGSADYLAFWDVPQRDTPRDLITGEVSPFDTSTWESGGHWWWFRSARVIQDLDLNNDHSEVIDEFPAFSFLLSDVHPHVLALPFVFLAIGAALNVLLKGRRPSISETLFYGFIIGGLGFLNTWDAPIYLVVFAGAELLRRLMRNRKGRITRDDLLSLVVFVGTLVGLLVLFYLPFWLGFRSQAGGVLPNLLNPTQTQQLFIMFGPLLLLLAPFLLVEARRGGERMNWGGALLLVGGLLVLLVLALAALVGIGLSVPSLRSGVLDAVQAAGGLEAVLPVIAERRLVALLTPVILLVGLMLVVGRLLPRLKRDEADAAAVITYSPSSGFALLLVAVGLLLVLAPEFVYLRDNFGTRMNTIFKFYYQAWVVWSLAAAYGAYIILADVRTAASPFTRAAYGGVLSATLVLGLMFTGVGVYSRAGVEAGHRFPDPLRPATLDGGSSFGGGDDYQAIMCLNQWVDGDSAVAVEAIGPAYRWEYGRVAALTGIPILLGWENHEGQWRGATYAQVAGSRNPDIRVLYEDPRWEMALPVIERYGIDYVFFGSSERNQYGTGGEDKFRENAAVVCERGNSRFYRVGTPAASVPG